MTGGPDFSIDALRREALYEPRELPEEVEPADWATGRVDLFFTVRSRDADAEPTTRSVRKS